MLKKTISLLRSILDFNITLTNDTNARFSHIDKCTFRRTKNTIIALSLRRTFDILDIYLLLLSNNSSRITVKETTLLFEPS